jgi:hypothetical protein
VADGDPDANVTVGACVRVIPSVVSVAVSVICSATESVTAKDTLPSEPVIAGDAAPMTAVPELAWRLIALPATGLLVDVSKVTTAVVPAAPSGAGVGAVTVDWLAETVRVPNVTVAVLESTVLDVVSVAAKVTVSGVESVAVNVATPDALVTLGVAAGVMVACPLP